VTENRRENGEGGREREQIHDSIITIKHETIKWSLTAKGSIIVPLSGQSGFLDHCKKINRTNGGFGINETPGGKPSR